MVGLYALAALTLEALHFVLACIYAFCILLTTNRDYIPKQQQPVGVCNGDEIVFSDTVIELINVNYMNLGVEELTTLLRWWKFTASRGYSGHDELHFL
jgi:hypothetical protein